MAAPPAGGVAGGCGGPAARGGGARGAAGAAGGRHQQWLFGCCIKARCSAHTGGPSPPQSACMLMTCKATHLHVYLHQWASVAGEVIRFPPWHGGLPPPRRAREGRAQLWPHRPALARRQALPQNGCRGGPCEPPPLPPGSPRPARAPSPQTQRRILCLSSQSGARHPSPLPPSPPPSLLFYPPSLLLHPPSFLLPPPSLFLPRPPLLFHPSSLLLPFHPSFSTLPLPLHPPFLPFIPPFPPSIPPSPPPSLHLLLQLSFSPSIPPSRPSLLFHPPSLLLPHAIPPSPRPEPDPPRFHARGGFLISHRPGEKPLPSFQGLRRWPGR